MTLPELEARLTILTLSEKVQALSWLMADLTHIQRGIEKTPNVCGGDACIMHTRIPVWVLAGWHRLGWSDARILENYPTLSAIDLVNAWAYVSVYPDEIEQAIRENEED